ncbi:MAG: folate family ECF transporter S component [bacterium]
MKITPKQIVTLALFAALSIVLTRLLSIRISIGGIEGIRLGIGDLPIILAGVAFGPVAGGLVGAISDAIGYFINPQGPYVPHFTVIYALMGIIPGLFAKFGPKKKGQPLPLLWPLVVGILVEQLIVEVTLIPLTLYTVFKLPAIFKIDFGLFKFPVVAATPGKVALFFVKTAVYPLFIDELINRVPFVFTEGWRKEQAPSE